MRPNLGELIREAVAKVMAMTPEEVAELREAQRQSWARGFGPCEHGIRDWEDCQMCRADSRQETSE